MSFLDLDEWLIDLAGRVDLVYSPIADVKTYPEHVDVALVEGAIANTDHLDLIQRVRRHTKMLISFGDCAVTGNVTALRNPVGAAMEVLRPVYLERDHLNARIPDEPGIVPRLLDRVRPVHDVVPVDLFRPGCPPHPTVIRAALEAILGGNYPALSVEQRRFG